MPSFFIVGKTSISLKGIIFDYRDFYLFMKRTMEDRGYFIEEKKYTHSPKKGKIHDGFYWKCLKNLDDYNRFIMEIISDFHNEDITVVKKEKKERKEKGSGLITLRATLLTDYDTKWENNPFVNFMKTVFEHLFEKSSVDKNKEVLNNEMYELENEVKSYFSVQRMI